MVNQMSRSAGGGRPQLFSVQLRTGKAAADGLRRRRLEKAGREGVRCRSGDTLDLMLRVGTLAAALDDLARESAQLQQRLVRELLDRLASFTVGLA